MITYVLKQKGYEAGIKKTGGTYNSRYVFKNIPYVKGGYECMREMCERFSAEERPTGIFAVSDQVAMGIYRYCNEYGYNIPKDFEVVGFSGTKIALDSCAHLATIDQMPYETGKLAGETLIKMIEGGSLLQKKIVIEPKLILE